VVVYAVLGVAVMTIIAGGVIGIKKFVMWWCNGDVCYWTFLSDWGQFYS
jgi:hypothetical protein